MGMGPRKLITWCDVPKGTGSLGLRTRGLKVRFGRGGWVQRPIK